MEAGLRGVGSHGLVRLPIYLHRTVDGGTVPRPLPAR